MENTIIYRSRQNSSPRVVSKQFNLSPSSTNDVHLLRCVTARRCGRRHGTIASHRRRKNCEHLREASDSKPAVIRADVQELRHDRDKHHDGRGPAFPFVDGKLVVVLEFKHRFVDGLL